MTTTRNRPAHALLWGVLWVVLQLSAATTQAAEPKLTDNTVELPSGKVFYRDSGGNGVPAVFLHAASGNSMMWEYQTAAFVRAGYRFIAVDYRGLPSATRATRVASSTLLNELVTRLNLPKFHLIGTAAGGGAALEYALAYRDHLRSITVANAIGNVRDKEYLELHMRLRPSAFNQLPLDIRELGPSYRAANPEGVKRWLALTNPSMREGPGRPAPGGIPWDLSDAQNDSNSVSWANLEKLTIPTLMLTGDADLYVPPAVLRLFQSHIKHAEIHIVPETGHSAFWENPDNFNRTVLAFISKN